MSSGQGWFESDEDYRNRIAEEANEHIIEEASGSAPSKGWFENDEDYRNRIAEEANEHIIEEASGSASSKGWFENDEDYRNRITEEANEHIIEETSGSAPSKGWFEKDHDYRSRIAHEANIVRARDNCRSDEESNSNSESYSSPSDSFDSYSANPILPDNQQVPHMVHAAPSQFPFKLIFGICGIAVFVLLFGSNSSYVGPLSDPGQVHWPKFGQQAQPQRLPQSQQPQNVEYNPSTAMTPSVPDEGILPIPVVHAPPTVPTSTDKPIEFYVSSEEKLMPKAPLGKRWTINIDDPSAILEFRGVNMFSDGTQQEVGKWRFGGEAGIKTVIPHADNYFVRVINKKETKITLW